MVNPAFSESQLKNLRRQNRHLVSTHRRKLVFLQASRNPAHGSGRPFFVRDVPVPASFCSVPVASPFAPPAPVSAAPQLRPFCRPHRFCPRLPASPARRTEFGFVLCALPFRIPARHPGNGPARHLSVRPLSLRPSGSRFRSSGRSAVPSASALVFQPLPHAGQSSGPYCACCRSASPPGTPGMVPSRHLSARLLSLQPSPLRLPFPQLHPFCRPHRFCLRLPASPARRTEFGFVLCALPFRFPARHPGNGPARHLSARLLSLQPSPLRLPFPQLPSSDRSAVLTASALVFQPLPHTGQSSDSFYARCRSASPPGTPGTVPPDIFLSGLRPSGSRFRSSPAPTVLPSSPLLPSSSSLSLTPDRARIRSMRAAVPHPRPAPRERSRPTSFCPAFAPPAPASAAPPFSLFPAAAPPLPAATGRTGCSFGPAREKGCLTDLRQPRFYPYAIRELLPIRNFQRIGKTRQTAPFIRTAVRELLPPPPNMPLKGSKNLPDSSVRSRIAQPADRLPAPAAAGLSSSSHRSSGSPDR